MALNEGTNVLPNDGSRYFNGLWDGAAFRAQRGNLQGTLLSSAARTAFTTSASQSNYNARGVAVILKVTAAGAGGGLRLQIRGIAPDGTQFNLNVTPTAVTATGTYVYMVYPGISGTSAQIAQSTSQVLPRTWDIVVDPLNADSYTYSVEYSLIQ